jgi:adenosylhomocysteine nucleosidase
VGTAGQTWSADSGELPDWISEVRGVRVGRLLTVDQLVRLPDEKRSLGQQHAALALDMESLAVALACRERRVPFLGIRVISDEVDEQLPPDIERLLSQKSRAAQAGAVLGSLWRRPSTAKDLWRLQENALAASERLAGFLTAVMKHL